MRRHRFYGFLRQQAHTRGTMGTSLKQLNRVVVQFSRWSAHGRSAREFLARISAAKALASNPECKIVRKIEGDSSDMDTAELLQQASFAGQKLTSEWGTSSDNASLSGTAEKVPMGT
ncbi:hypothetical protein WJX72_003298 [[Myrmecia] bisecta]|uniref:Large ribosomal subunit protein mL53 n=1 Tax=[Myrmecia] bisecta TaxID=41462 RepID=A0AAW1PFU3_9CHLO